MESFVNYQGEPHIGTFCGPQFPFVAFARYIQMASVVLNLSAVKDTAERCVKDVQDFANTARDGE